MNPSQRKPNPLKLEKYAGKPSKSSSNLLEGAEIATPALAQVLERLYTDPPYYQQLLDAGYARATEPAFRWETISEQWNTVLHRLTEEIRQDQDICSITL